MLWKDAVLMVAGLALCASAASKTPLVEARFEGAKSLLIEFREPMYNWDNAVRGDLVRTTPALPAKCAWESDTRLSCRLESAAAQATRYRIDVAAGLASQSGKPLGAQVLYVETARPSASARIERWRSGVPSIEVSTDMPVDAAALHASLRLELDGKPVAFPQPRPLPPAWKGDTRTRFAIGLPRIARENAELELAIRPGLHTTAGPLTGRQDDVLLKARLNAPFELRGVACEGVGKDSLAPVSHGTVIAACMPDEPVQLVFSHPLDLASRTQVERLVAEAIGSGWAAGDDGRHRWFEAAPPFAQDDIREPQAQWLRIGNPKPAQAIDLVLGGEVRSADGTPLPSVIVRIRAGDAQPHLHSRQKALIADGARVPLLVEAVNAGETTLKLSGVGLHSIDTQVTARSPRQGSAPQPVRSAEADRVLADGGWVRWTPEQDGATSDWSMDRSIEFAAPAFDVMALSGRREVLAWANEWDRDAPVAGALIELLWREPGSSDPRVVTQGRTTDDGTVLLRLPEDLVVPDEETDDFSTRAEGPMWMLRAVQSDSSGIRRAVLPAGDVDPSRSGLGAAAERKMWGVSDRPMYHAGDTVHYRLWQRELDGTRLRAPRVVTPVMLRLQNGDNDKVVLEWKATAAVDGSLSGELALPVHLTDATYCIGIGDGYNTDGSCFFVGTYRAQDLWLEARSRGGVLRDGERFIVDASGGYFSGGPAAGAELTRAAVVLEPEPLESAYPQFDGFTFVAVEDYDTETVELAGISDYEALDEQGAVHIDVPVEFEGKPGDIEHRPAFGVLATEMEASPEDREGTSAYERSTRYARFDRYVGLRSHPDWFGSREPVSLEAVVITAHGKEVPDARVEVSINYLASYDWKQQGTPVARCVLRVRVATPCVFPRERTGFYRLTARSGDAAAPAVLQRYVWSAGSGLEANVTEPELTVVAQAQNGKPARLLVQQPFARARALLVMTLGGTILGHRVQAIEGNVQEIALPRENGWDGMLRVKALVREAASARVEAGFRMPVRVESLETYLPAQEPEAVAPPVSLRFATASARPGTTARITVRNNSARPRQVALSVMDDALRAQAQRWLPYADPVGPMSFRESLQMRGDGSVREYGFDDWTGDEWRWMLPWADAEAAAKALRERAQPVMAAPPAPPAPGYESDKATSLDRVEVTGSRIKRADIAESNEASAPDPFLRLDREAGHAGSPRAAAIRSSFADTALWMPDIRLAPGESREIEVELPDNLTRWRAVVWSADDGAGFAMVDAALEVGLPVEARLQAPVRVYPGDTSRVTTSVRHVADVAASASTELSIRTQEGSNPINDLQTLALGPRAQASTATVLHPETVGTLELVASASTPAGSDAVSGRIEVASPLVTTRKLQAGWINEEPIRLPLPVIPGHAHDPSLRVSLLRGGAGLTAQWTEALRTYPHRCWEQILSRAVGAALAIERHDAAWPDAASTVAEALDNAAVFQLDDGSFVYFAGDGGYSSKARVTLTAYTLRAFSLLRELGHRVPDRVESDARDFLGQVGLPAAGGSGIDEGALARFAFASAEHAPKQMRDLDLLWAQWKQLSFPVQVASVQAFAKAGHPAAGRATKRLLESAPLRGNARSLRLPRRYDAWMSSDLREQCALIEMLRRHPGVAKPRVRRELLMGLNDLYAGGVASVDTQSAAYCLMALREPRGDAASTLQASATIGAREQLLQLRPGEAQADWDAGEPGGPRLDVAVIGENAASASYVAELTYQEDAREAQASAVGLSIERRHAVLRDGAWKPVGEQMLREGDWIRITLVVRSTAQREFVALTDDAPGGLQPTDLSLSGVGTADLKRIAEEGSAYFDSRRLDARHPRFYAESLPPGEHEVHYFARVGNSGDYLAAPAVAELMYGQATYARTAATRLRIEPAN